MVKSKAFLYKTVFAILMNIGCLALSIGQEREQSLLLVDSIAVAETDYDRMFRLMSDDKATINTLYKFNAVDWGQLKPSIIIETQLCKSISAKPWARLSAVTWDMSEGFHYALESGLNFNIYHNLNKRTKSGKDCNGFSGNYFSIGAAMLTSDYASFTQTVLDKRKIEYGSSLVLDNYNVYTLQAGYGIQRRFAKLGYLDLQAGIQQTNFATQQKKSVTPYLTIEIGFGLTYRKIKAWIE